MKFRALLNFPMGLFLGYLVATTVYLLLDENYLGTWSKFFVYSISAGITLLAAGLAWASNQQGVATQNELAEKRRIASLAAARAVLPLALMQLSEMTEKAIGFSLEDDPFFNDAGNTRIVAAALEIDLELMATIQKCIEFSDSETQRWMAAMIAHYQVAYSRLCGGISDPHRHVTDHTKAHHAKDWAIVRALVLHLYGFARGSVERAPKQLDLADFGLPLLHPKFGHRLFELAGKKIAEAGERYGDGTIDKFEI